MANKKTFSKLSSCLASAETSRTIKGLTLKFNVIKAKKAAQGKQMFQVGDVKQIKLSGEFHWAKTSLRLVEKTKPKQGIVFRCSGGKA